MKKIVLAFILIGSIVYFSGCTKGAATGFTSCNNLPVTSDSAALLDFARKYNITPASDTSGLYYQIIDSGTGTNPISTSRVYVTYIGEFMNGDIFDSTTNSATTGFLLSNLINGWQLGLPKIKTGGRIKLLLPSALAYGCQGAGTTVPANAPVFFDITLVSLQ